MLFGPKALGGDELHIIVPLSRKEVKRVANELDKKLWKHLKQYGLASSSEWAIAKKNKTGRLVLKNEDDLLPVFPRQMWWFGVVELPDDEDEIQLLINDFSENITEMKSFIRERWKGSKSLFHPM